MKIYSNRHACNILLEGFKYGFQLNYTGPSLPKKYKNLLSVEQNITEAIIKMPNEINLGRMAGPFHSKPISNLRYFPTRLVPKKTGGLRLMTNFMYQKNSVLMIILTKFTKVFFHHLTMLFQ